MYHGCVCFCKAAAAKMEAELCEHLAKSGVTGRFEEPRLRRLSKEFAAMLGDDDHPISISCGSGLVMILWCSGTIPI